MLRIDFKIKKKKKTGVRSGMLACVGYVGCACRVMCMCRLDVSEHARIQGVRDEEDDQITIQGEGDEKLFVFSHKTYDYSMHIIVVFARYP